MKLSTVSYVFMYIQIQTESSADAKISSCEHFNEPYRARFCGPGPHLCLFHSRAGDNNGVVQRCHAQIAGRTWRNAVKVKVKVKERELIISRLLKSFSMIFKGFSMLFTCFLRLVYGILRDFK